MQRLLIGNIFREDVNRSDAYGGLSSIIKVGEFHVRNFEEASQPAMLILAACSFGECILA
jgi:hypothetical protein